MEKTRHEANVQTARRSIDWIADSILKTEKRIRSRIDGNLKNNDSIEQLCHKLKDEEQLISEIFIIKEDGELLTPLFSRLWEFPPKERIATELRNTVSNPLLARAESLEFQQKKYLAAAETYSKLFDIESRKNARARILNRIARCYKKAGRTERAISVYQSLIQQNGLEDGETGLPLGLLARFQLASIYQDKEDLLNATKTHLALYNQLRESEWRLTESQFHFYAARMEDSIPASLSLMKNDTQVHSLQSEWKDSSDLMMMARQHMHETALLYGEFKPEPATSDETNIFRKDSTIYASEYLDNEWFMVGKFNLANSNTLLIRYDHLALLDNLIAFGTEEDISPINNPIQIVDENGILKQADIGDPEVRVSEPVFSIQLESPLPPWTLHILRTDTQAGAKEFQNRRILYLGLVFIVLGALSFGGYMGLRGMGKELELAQLKADFVATVSHELRTPLTSIRYMLDLLKRGRVPDENKRQSFYETLFVESERLSDIIENLLDFSRIEAGMKQYDLKTIESKSFTANLAKRSEERINPKGFHLEVDLADTLSPINIDEESLSRALYNLLDNAVKYSGENRTIHLSCWEDSEDIYWEIKDHGIGISPEEQRHIFDKFYRSSELTDDNIKGSGIGLTLVKRIAEAHGGEIKVESQKGQGSRFILRIPKMTKMT